MKSKSFEIKNSPKDGKNKHNKTFDFVAFYKTASESNEKLSEKNKSFDNVNKENSSSLKTSTDTPTRERSPNKKKKKNKNEVDISHIVIDGQTLNRGLNTPSGTNSPVGVAKGSSTPYADKKQTPRVKSIMKNSSSNDDAMDESTLSFSSHKPKKRNKSVSFMLEDNEEVVVKKTKSDESVKVDKKSKKVKDNEKDAKKKLKKFKHNRQAEKENAGVINMDVDPKSETADNKTTKSKYGKHKNVSNGEETHENTDNVNEVTSERKKKVKKIKRKKAEESSEPTENESNNNDDIEAASGKTRKLKKKKRTSKTECPETIETEGEPASKSRKKETKPDIAEDLENLSIGDNAHTLSNLLDEMTVADKDKKKKNKVRRKKEKTTKTASISSSETADLEKIEEGKEKVKWKKRKWNKDKKGDANDDYLVTTVVVENMPLKSLLNYKKLLSDHFGKIGLIKKIGIAEVYPTEDSKPVFTTTVTFYSDASATKALEEDNTLLEGSRVRVKRPLPATQTTLVVRSYAELTEQSLSSVFSGAGKIRNIRHLVKGKKAMSTAFIEFDGPESVERALKMAEDAKIGAKKIHVSKFEQRATKKNLKPKAQAESENEGDSEDSND